MKCVQNLSTNEVKRVSEDRATELVQKGWKFVPKKVWKGAEDTTWTKNVNPPNPMRESKKRQREMRMRSVSSK